MLGVRHAVEQLVAELADRHILAHPLTKRADFVAPVGTIVAKRDIIRSLKLYSELGVGTTVKLYLPRAEAAAPADSVPIEASVPIQARHEILVVEDDPGVRLFAVSAARELGFVVIEADSAAVAIERLKAHSEISILLTDVVMPQTGGRQLADAALAERPGLQVIYMTGYTRNAIVHNGVLDRGVRLLTKPFTVLELERELRYAVAQLNRRASEAADAPAL